ncbi:MAG: 2'-5' RNA ligase family protein [Synechococcales bacterium]|nr:2'-5' RNA ligase family protein [Synechococcales bacterium]
MNELNQPNRVSRWFIALIPPQEMQVYANQIKQMFADQYGSCKAFTSPPHVTLHPPFTIASREITEIAHQLTIFAADRPAVPVTLSGFGAFSPRVIYINVLPTAALLAMQAELLVYCCSTLGILDPLAKAGSQIPASQSSSRQDRPFVPHLTVAFRDLTVQQFHRAWPEFANRSIELDGQPIDRYEFLADQLTLLRHDGQRWVIHQQFPFGSAIGAIPHV